MGHYGKHIIDPETGLCEICDKDAIREIREGKQPGKQVYYSNHDDGFSYRSNNNETPYIQDRYEDEIDDERTPRVIRQSVLPAPTVRSRRVIREEPIDNPIVIRRRIVRRNPPPSEEVIIHRSSPRNKAYYYVDKEGQMLPQNYTPPAEPPRRYVVQSMGPPPPPARTIRIARRHAQTPPPPVTEIRHSGPRRLINSDTEIIERQQRVRHDNAHYSQTPPRNIEMYHIEAQPIYNHRSSLDSPIPTSRNMTTPPPNVIYQDDGRRKQRKIEPMERRNHVEPEPTVVRRVYKKLPPGKSVPSNDKYNSNENVPRSVRNNKNHPPPRQYASSPQLANGNHRSLESTKNPSIYYIRPVDEY
ncbi:unnamed protein product [Rotaria sp. Silwood1]|nr:unnamed protein product [Rotaria sp. Silwood1]CAF0767794.1 unnamed protein product [Rotaria sp. Silwood1]CAF0782950.1 unnamed protein product [Rotaria sp. Silwood1]CAF3324247.1 unnamed protein product [Rotaria sp. Silwood1]CAF3340898.1 unnamed protein product [Rotaria sp. Silwood1]